MVNSDIHANTYVYWDIFYIFLHILGFPKDIQMEYFHRQRVHSKDIYIYIFDIDTGFQFFFINLVYPAREMATFRQVSIYRGNILLYPWLWILVSCFYSNWVSFFNYTCIFATLFIFSGHLYICTCVCQLLYIWSIFPSLDFLNVFL